MKTTGRVFGSGVSVLDPAAAAPEGVSEAEWAEFRGLCERTVAEPAVGGEDGEGPGDWALVAEVEELLAAQAGGRWVDPAQELAGGLASAGAGLGRASLGPGELVGVFDAGVAAGLEAAGRVRAQVVGVMVGLAVEASSRGLHAELGLSLVSWLQQRCEWLSRQEACQVQDVVRAAGTHWGADLARAVIQGRTGVHRGAVVARTMRRLVGCLSPEQAEDYAAIATGAAVDPAISDGDLELVCKKLLVDLLDKEPRDRAKETAQELRRVSRRPLGRGLTRFTVDAPEGDAALIEGVLNGALAAPAPQEDGRPDPRVWGQRAYDALLMVINRGLSNPGAPPSTGRASVMITIKADPVTGKPVGAGVTALGQVLDAEQVGRFACLGDVTPIALGQFGEPLALGRTVRLATPGQFKALMVRDSQCTFPGCDVPGTWCDAHHLIWWCRGGGTDIGFLVLLCPRHHSLVHDKDLMATVAGSVVTWHV